MEVPFFFRCPISMELMKDPVTISTGVTYERKNIERWFHVYKKTTCPATMQSLHSFDLTPNHTLQRLIAGWQASSTSSFSSPSSSSPPSPLHPGAGGLPHLLGQVASAPFKTGPLKKLRSVLEDHYDQESFVKNGGIEVMGNVVLQVLVDAGDFYAFRACEEALGVLNALPLTEEVWVQVLCEREFMDAMAIMLQRGSSEARLHSASILRKMMKSSSKKTWTQFMTIGDDQAQHVDLYKPLLELLSDEISTRASSMALDVLIEITSLSKKNLVKAIEAGAVYTLIELLPDANRAKCEKMLYLLKQLCSCSEGRSAFVEHGMGIAMVSKKVMRVSEVATRLGVKILWLICSSNSTDRVLEDLLMFGSVKKLMSLLHIDGQSSTKDKAMKIIKLYGRSWWHLPCFPVEIKDCFSLMHDTR